jgi:hypothetical protein
MASSAASAIFGRELLELRLSGALFAAFQSWAAIAVDQVISGLIPDVNDALTRDIVLAAVPDEFNDAAANYLSDLQMLTDVVDVLTEVNQYARAQGMGEDATRRLMRSAVKPSRGLYAPVPTRMLELTRVRELVPVLAPARSPLPEHPSLLAPDIPFAEYGHTYRTRLEAIGRTVATSLSGRAARAEAQRTGQDLRWITTGDNRVRDSHRAAQGQTVAADEWFRVGGVPMEYPGDPAAPRDEIANCRCVLTLVTPPERRYVQRYIPREWLNAAAQKPDETVPNGSTGTAASAAPTGTPSPAAPVGLTAAAPTQARAPKGTAIGGQWIDTPSGMLRTVTATGEEVPGEDVVAQAIGEPGTPTSYAALAAAGGMHQKVNPGYEDLTGRQFNCTKVAMATELQARGYTGAIAANEHNFSGVMTSDVEKVFPGSRASLVLNSKGAAYEEMTMAGPGARFIVMGNRTGGAGHAWNAEVTEDGDLREYDNQVPYEYTGAISGGQGLYMDYRDYRVIRVDDAGLSGELVTGIDWSGTRDEPFIINDAAAAADLADITAAVDPAPALAALGIDVATADLVDEGDRYRVIPTADQVIYDDRATFIVKASGEVIRELDRGALTAAAPMQARAPKGTPIGGEWIDTPGGLLGRIGTSAAPGGAVSVEIGDSVYTGDPAPAHGREDDIRAHGMSTPTLIHSKGDPASAQAFQNAIQRAKDANPYGASVYVYPTSDYEGMDLWLTEDGMGGIALKGDDIVSGFNTPGSANRHFVQHAMATAQAAGGTHADAFDTVLPDLYAQAGMEVVARTPWNDEYAPDGWDYDQFAKFNGGRPDVVFLKYNPDGWWGQYTPGQGQVVEDYDDGVALTASAEGHVDGLVVPLFTTRLLDGLRRRVRSEQVRHKLDPVLLSPSHPDMVRDEPGGNPGLYAAPAQARAPKGTPIGGEFIDTPGRLLAGIGVRNKLTLGFAAPADVANARSAAKAKEAALPEPTAADRAIAAARHGKSKRQGGDDRPGSQRRKKLRQDLLTEFGDGTTCPCLNCGRVLDVTTVSMDRIIPGADNGRYNIENLIPMDYDCNRARSDSDFDEMASTWAAAPIGDEPAVTPGTVVRAHPSGWGRDESGDLDGADDAPSLEGVPEWIEGPLEVVPVDAYLKHIVGGYDVDPASIEEGAP